MCNHYPLFRCYHCGFEAALEEGVLTNHFINVHPLLLFSDGNLLDIIRAFVEKG
jgi:hypothetical protein